MPTFQMQIETAHAVLFLCDPESVSTPEDTAASFVTATDDCLAFWVMHYVDGASLVTVSDAPCEAAGLKVFDGEIGSSSGVLTVMDSLDFRYLNVPVPLGRQAVEVWADDDRNPDWVWIKLAAIQPR